MMAYVYESHMSSNLCDDIAPSLLFSGMLFYIERCGGNSSWYFLSAYSATQFFSFYVNDFLLIISKHRVSLWPKSVSTGQALRHLPGRGPTS